MTKRERAAIYEACERIETYRSYLSCVALQMTSFEMGVDWDLLKRYSLFYQMADPFWPGLPGLIKDCTLESQSQRILLLLLFLEAEGDV